MAENFPTDLSWLSFFPFSICLVAVNLWLSRVKSLFWLYFDKSQQSLFWQFFFYFFQCFMKDRLLELTYSPTFTESFHSLCFYLAFPKDAAGHLFHGLVSHSFMYIWWNVYSSFLHILLFYFLGCNNHLYKLETHPLPAI